jgi:hypothetical protein
VAGWVALINPRGILEWIELRRGVGGKVWRSRLVGGVFAVLGPGSLIKGIAQLVGSKPSERSTMFRQTYALSPVLAAVVIAVAVLVGVHTWRTNSFLQGAWTAGGLPRACAVLATLAALSFATLTVFGYVAAGLLCWVLGGAAAAGLFLTRSRCQAS